MKNNDIEVYEDKCEIKLLESVLKKNLLSFEEKVKKIIEYHDKHDKLSSSKDKDSDIKTFGRFLGNQKTCYKKKKLSEEKYNLLVKIPKFKERLEK